MQTFGDFPRTFLSKNHYNENLLNFENEGGAVHSNASSLRSACLSADAVLFGFKKRFSSFPDWIPKVQRNATTAKKESRAREESRSKESYEESGNKRIEEDGEKSRRKTATHR